MSTTLNTEEQPSYNNNNNDPTEETIDDWQLDMNFHVFSQHTLQSISSRDAEIELECVESLTPVDMMNLANGEHDATGHCVWMGAFLLLDALGELSSECFRGKTVVELGCGTGIGGIGLLSMTDKELRPKYVLLTDADPDALQVCRRNCQHNQLQEESFQIQELSWGEELKDTSFKFDTTLATDVLYDIGLLQPLLYSAHSALKEKGQFVLSHVPRACYSSEHPPVDNLDQFIVEKAEQAGFVLQKKITPMELPQEYRSKGALNETVSLQHMNEVGAAIFVFLKRTDIII